jgi:hypothetical protein
MAADEKTLAIVDFLMAGLQAQGHARERILVSGYLHEAIVAAEMGARVNPKAAGYDVEDPLTGEKHELKNSTAAVGSKVNVNLHVPRPKHDESKGQYYARLREANEAKGDVTITHRPDDEAVHTYHLSHAFVSMLMEYKNCWKVTNVNIGGLCCPTCTKVHRLKHLEVLDKAWQADPDEFDEAEFDVRVKETC